MATVAGWLKLGKEILKRGDALNGRNDADYILAGVLGISRLELYLNPGKEVEKEKDHQISRAMEKRISGMPIQYILGETEFFSLPFYLKPGVFIPRPETELLVEEALKICKAEDKVIIADICTGCGNIALSLAGNIPCRVMAVDISGFSIEIAKENAVRLGLSDSVEFLEGDLFEPIERKNYFNRFQLIVSNPPYISAGEWEGLPGEVKYYEPRQALYGGEDGLDFYKRISKDAGRLIKKGGYLLLEAGPAASIAAILKEDGWQDIKIIKDYNNMERIISCKWIKS